MAVHITPFPQNAKGFTLVELIIVIVLLGIVGTFSFSYLGFGAKIFSDSVGRDQLLNQSRFAVERLSRELRNALPRSIRVRSADKQRCIEFVPIISSSSYVQLPRPGPTASLPFVAVTPLLEPGQTIINQYLYVYASNHSHIYNPNSNRRKTIASSSQNLDNSGLSNIAFSGSSTFTTGSPAQRFFITEQPVSWCLSDNAELERFSMYDFSITQPTRSSLVASAGLGNAAYEVMGQLVHNDLDDSAQYPFRVFEATLQRNSLVQLDLRFGRSTDTDPLRIQHEVFVPNVP